VSLSTDISFDNHYQTTLDLFEPASFTELCQLFSIDNMSLHPSRRLKTGWYLTIHRSTKLRELHYPVVLDSAPDAVKRSLLQWANLPVKIGPASRAEYRERKRHFEKTVRAFLDDHSPSGRHTRERFGSLSETQGTVYDLNEVFSAVNKSFFNGKISALLRWGASSSKTSFQKTCRDPDGVQWHSITIAGVYNHPQVPRFAIEAIMYHEMLHIHIPPEIRNGRRIVHGSDFKSTEKAFPHFDAWRKWERESLPKLLRKIRKHHR